MKRVMLNVGDSELIRAEALAVELRNVAARISTAEPFYSLTELVGGLVLFIEMAVRAMTSHPQISAREAQVSLLANAMLQFGLPEHVEAKLLAQIYEAFGVKDEDHHD